MQFGMVLFMGLVRRGEYEHLLKQGLPLGALVDVNSQHKPANLSGFDLIERFDFSRPLPELIEAVRSIHARHPLACLFNVGEYYVAQTAEVAEALGFPYLSPASARICLDKAAMRQRFRDRIGPDAAARFHVVTSESELIECADQLGYPVFLQPANVAASMWCTCNTDPDRLKTHYRAMLTEVPQYYDKLGKKDTTLTVILAEYLTGPNTSIDCLVDQSGQVYTTPLVDVLTGQDVGLDDFHHFARIVPAQINDADQAMLRQRAIAGVRALEITSSAAHVEFIGTHLGEIAARPGGNRPHLLNLAYGLDMIPAQVQILAGQTPDLSMPRQDAAAVVTPFSGKTGSLRSIRHLDEIRSLPTYLYHETRIAPGRPVGLARDGYRAPLYIELFSEDAEAVRRDVDRIASWTDLYEVE